MQLKTILNHVEKLKYFVYSDARFAEDTRFGPCIEVRIRPRKGSKAICSRCGHRRPTYDHLKERHFQFVPLWGIAVVFLYCMRRVNCPTCGVLVESVPWATGKSPVCRSFALFLADWAKLLSWQEVARRFGMNWRQVFESVRGVVRWGLKQRDITGVSAIGIDEVQFGSGHSYLTVIYQLCGDKRRLLFVTPRRDAAALNAVFEEAGEAWCSGIAHVCTDMWQAYLKVINAKLLNAVHILDRFHIVKLLNEAVDTVRKQEAAKLRKEGVTILKGMKYVFLKRPENLSEKQKVSLNAIMKKRWLASVRAWLWKEQFQLFWEYTSPYWARRYLQRWCKGAMHSGLTPLKKFVRTIRKHEDLLLNWFRARKAFSSGAVEGMNRKLNLVTRKSYGFKNYEVLKIALFHTLGELPEPEATHRF